MQSIRTEGNIAQLGPNYQFGAPLAVPVIARY